MSNPTARAAREEALKRHRAEVRKWKSLCILLAGSTFISLVFVVMYEIRSAGPPQVWRTDVAPVGEPYYVVTKGYVRKKDGRWCSFDTGEPISVTHWTTKNP